MSNLLTYIQLTLDRTQEMCDATTQFRILFNIVTY